MDTFVLHTGNYAEKSNAFQNNKTNNLSISRHRNMTLQVVVWSICATAFLLPGGNNAKVLSQFMGKYYNKWFSLFIPPIHHPGKILKCLSKTMHSADRLRKKGKTLSLPLHAHSKHWGEGKFCLDMEISKNTNYKHKIIFYQMTGETMSQKKLFHA